MGSILVVHFRKQSAPKHHHSGGYISHKRTFSGIVLYCTVVRNEGNFELCCAARLWWSGSYCIRFSREMLWRNITQLVQFFDSFFASQMWNCATPGLDIASCTMCCFDLFNGANGACHWSCMRSDAGVEREPLYRFGIEIERRHNTWRREQPGQLR